MSARAAFRAALLAAAAAATLAPARARAQGGAPPDAARGLAARVAAADGPAVVRFAARPEACGDGRGLVALGEHMVVDGGNWYTGGGGSARRACLHGPVRATLSVRNGAVDDVRVRVGAAGPADAEPARDLGAVPAPEAAAYFLALAGRATGRAAEQAVVAAALADGADVWRPLVALARRHADERVARAAMHWMGAAAPAEAVPAVAALLGDAGERRVVRDGAALALAFAPGGAGVPALAAAAAGAPSAGGGDAWARERAVFWLGTARDPRGRAALRLLAAADTAPERVRGQAIFALGHLDRGDRDAGGADGGNGAFLRALYPRLASDGLREKVVMGVAQGGDPAGLRWLLDVAADARQTVEARKRALFWAGQQSELAVGDLVAAEPRLAGPELRRHYTFVLSQRREDAAVDRLVAIARADADRDVRRQAIFWLGQSRSPRARAYLESVVAP